MAAVYDERDSEVVRRKLENVVCGDQHGFE
jgi:hypothetical protein